MIVEPNMHSGQHVPILEAEAVTKTYTKDVTLERMLVVQHPDTVSCK